MLFSFIQHVKIGKSLNETRFVWLGTHSRLVLVGASIVHPDVTGVAASCIHSIPVKIFFSRSTHI